MPLAAAPQPPRASRGFSDAHLAITIAVTGSLIVGAVAFVRRYIHHSKTAEQRSSLAQIAVSAAHAYRDNVGPDGRHRLCTTSTYVPAEVTAIVGRNYQSSRTDWSGSDALSGWPCLRFEMTGPQYYRYHYESAGGSGPGAGYVATAEGDLDGDGTTSRFSVRGVVDANDQLPEQPEIVEETPYEE